MRVSTYIIRLEPFSYFSFCFLVFSLVLLKEEKSRTCAAEHSGYFYEFDGDL